jgi:hypothetical protein
VTPINYCEPANPGILRPFYLCTGWESRFTYLLHLKTNKKYNFHKIMQQQAANGHVDCDTCT